MKPQFPSGRAASLFTRKSANQTIPSPLLRGQTALSAAVSRRRFIRETARAVGATVGASILLPAVAGAGLRLNAAPRPIPNGLQFLGPGTPVFHVMAPGYPGFGNAVTDDPSSITNFNGHVGVTYVQDWGTHRQNHGEGKEASLGSGLEVHERRLRRVGRETPSPDVCVDMTGCLRC